MLIPGLKSDIGQYQIELKDQQVLQKYTNVVGFGVRLNFDSTFRAPNALSCIPGAPQLDSAYLEIRHVPKENKSLMKGISKMMSKDKNLGEKLESIPL